MKITVLLQASVDMSVPDPDLRWDGDVLLLNGVPARTLTRETRNLRGTRVGESSGVSLPVMHVQEHPGLDVRPRTIWLGATSLYRSEPGSPQWAARRREMEDEVRMDFAQAWARRQQTLEILRCAESVDTLSCHIMGVAP